MRETRLSGSEGGGAELNGFPLPLCNKHQVNPFAEASRRKAGLLV